MKKLTMIVAALTMTIPMPVAFATPAQAASNSWVQGFCKDILSTYPDAYPGMSVGQCVSLVTTEDNYYNGKPAGGFVAQACRFIQQYDPSDFDAYYASFTDCVHDGASAII